MTRRRNMTTYVHIVELCNCTKTVPHQGPLSHPLVLASKEALVEELQFWERDDLEGLVITMYQLPLALPQPPMNSDVQEWRNLPPLQGKAFERLHKGGHHVCVSWSCRL